jgi:hypothetical protein
MGACASVASCSTTSLAPTSKSNRLLQFIPNGRAHRQTIYLLGVLGVLAVHLFAPAIVVGKLSRYTVSAFPPPNTPSAPSAPSAGFLPIRTRRPFVIAQWGFQTGSRPRTVGSQTVPVWLKQRIATGTEILKSKSKETVVRREKSARKRLQHHHSRFPHRPPQPFPISVANRLQLIMPVPKAPYALRKG